MRGEQACLVLLGRIHVALVHQVSHDVSRFGHIHSVVVKGWHLVLRIDGIEPAGVILTLESCWILYLGCAMSKLEPRWRLIVIIIRIIITLERSTSTWWWSTSIILATRRSRHQGS